MSQAMGPQGGDPGPAGSVITVWVPAADAAKPVIDEVMTSVITSTSPATVVLVQRHLSPPRNHAVLRNTAPQIEPKDLAVPLTSLIRSPRSTPEKLTRRCTSFGGPVAPTG